MTTKGSQDRMLNALYAGLDQTERARLLARWARAGDGRELDRLRRMIPDAAAGTAFNRAIRILRQLHGPMVPMLVATGTAIERDTAMLLLVAQQMAQRREAHGILRRLWTRVGYPVTATEYRTVVEAERCELESLDRYAKRLAALDGSATNLYPGVAALLHEVPPQDEREDREGREGDGAGGTQIRQVLEAAIARGELPQPKRTEQESTLPRGVIADCGEGTMPDASEPRSPAVHVPVLELLGGESADWDVRSDLEQDAVVALRQALLVVCGDIMAALGLLDAADLDGLTLDPVTGAEREQLARRVDKLRPRSHDRDRDRLQELARVHARRRAEAQAYRAVIATLQATEFGGEDPVDPLVRALLSDLEAREAEFSDLWSQLVGALPPASIDDEAGTAWPPSLEDTAYLEHLQPALEAHLRGEWDV